MSPEESYALIKANLQEVLNPEIIEDVLFTQKRPLRVYWGTAPTGKPHCGYFVPMIKIAELLAAGCEVKILLADIHAFLDSVTAPIAQVEARAKYYEFVIKSLLTALGIDLSRLVFVMGSSYQKSEAYTWDRFVLDNGTRYSTALKAGSEVVKNDGDARLGGLQYPGMQALDEEYLGVDAQFGGVDQRKIFTFAIENLKICGYRTRAHLMNPMVPGLGEAVKMSASNADSKIDLIESREEVSKKLKKAKCEPKTVEGNGVIAFVEFVLTRALKLQGIEELTVERREGDPLIYTSIEKLKEDYAADTLTPQALKAATTKYLNDLLEPIRLDYANNQEWQRIEQLAYPPPPGKKKERVQKNKGDPAKIAAAKAAAAAKRGETTVMAVGDGVEQLAVKE